MNFQAWIRVAGSKSACLRQPLRTSREAWRPCATQKGRRKLEPGTHRRLMLRPSIWFIPGTKIRALAGSTHSRCFRFQKTPRRPSATGAPFGRHRKGRFLALASLSTRKRTCYASFMFRLGLCHLEVASIFLRNHCSPMSRSAQSLC